MADKKLSKDGLNKVWLKVMELVKSLTGNVDRTKGTLQEQVNELNSNLKPVQIPWTPFCPIDDVADYVTFNETLAYRVGNIVIVTFRLDLSEAVGGYIDIINLPIKPYVGLNYTDMPYKYFIYVKNDNEGFLSLRDFFPAGSYYFNVIYMVND